MLSCCMLLLLLLMVACVRRRHSNNFRCREIREIFFQPLDKFSAVVVGGICYQVCVCLVVGGIVSGILATGSLQPEYLAT